MKKNTYFIVGLLAPIFYFSLLYILGMLWEGYNPITTGMSEIGAVNSPYKDIMNYLGFSILGLSITYFSFGLRKKLKKSIQNSIIFFLTFISGLFLFLVGFFPCDANCIDITFTGKMHSLISTVPAIIMPIAAMLSANYFYKNISKTLGYMSFWLGIFSLSSGPIMFIPKIDTYSGLVQRMGIGLSLVWMMMVSYSYIKQSNKK